ncbi:PIN-like domain-containing protein [Pseudomonas sp. RW409]|uniref:PIN-like domain-containing protein n=1 Tax=Pseudomonas sp. RW409 TaxID=2202895 RepID=UPI000D72A943|nr:PIN-like domain-containing protein [Pseudomonas sp. RW409]PWY37982.1 histidine kinase [Pseudomonas sp. RW409]
MEDIIESLIKIYRGTDEIDFKEIWSEGLFVFDTNVLLDLYRMNQSTRSDLMGVLTDRSFTSRIWIGFQVALEFLNNRYEAIGDQKSAFAKVRDTVNKAIASYNTAFDNLNLEIGSLKLSQRHALINPEQFVNLENHQQGIKCLVDFIEHLGHLENEQADVHQHDSIKDFVLKAFEGKIGECFSKEKLEKIYAEGAIRYEKEIPPGYEDKKKIDIRRFQDKEFYCKYGDLILWNEILNKASTGEYKHIVLVTGDVKKDWWLQKRGKILGPRPELLDEIYGASQGLETFHMYNTSTFLRYAKENINSEIDESSIVEAKNLISTSNDLRELHDQEHITLPDILKMFEYMFPRLSVNIDKSVFDLPSFKVDPDIFYSPISEIYSNAQSHGADGALSIYAESHNSAFLISFKNKVNPSFRTTLPTSYLVKLNLLGKTEGKAGLTFITNELSRNDIQVEITHENGEYSITMKIPKHLAWPVIL